MERKKIRDEITHLINSIKEHSDNLINKENIPQLELEIILHKIEKLYEASIVFNYLHKLSDEKVIDFDDEEDEKPEGINSEVFVEKSNITLVESKPVTKFTETKVPTDLFGSELLTENEKLKIESKQGKKEEKKQTDKIQKPSISNLKAAIGINDKFRFTNQLFAENMIEYDTAIQQLNTSESLESAMNYLLNLQKLYQWDTEDETVKRLIDLVERRYS